jgi:predicted alpha/beta-hydrolase family hydrolase
LDRYGLLLAPGASASSNQPALVAVDRAATKAGLAVRRMDFPYTLAGRRAPDRAPVLIAAVVNEAASLAAGPGKGGARLAADRIFLGGRSMGGRMCSMAVAEGLPSAGLVLISYPLHPPGRPDKMRTDHFGALDLPCLFVSGTSDSFASPAELDRALELIPGPVTVHYIERGDHGLRGRDSEVATLVAGWITGLVSAR